VALDVPCPAGYAIQRFDRQFHKRDGFACGTGALDDYLREQASQAQARDLVTCYVLVEAAVADAPDRPVLGYVCIATASLPMVDPPPELQRLTKMPSVPALLLARMAVDIRHKKRGLGKYLLTYALQRALDVAQVAACMVVIVDAKDATAAAFYKKYGFETLPDNPLRLYMSMNTVRKL
jgi:ribosomal protein S18 acetylase RimI-like enzyme